MTALLTCDPHQHAAVDAANKMPENTLVIVCCPRCHKRLYTTAAHRLTEDRIAHIQWLVNNHFVKVGVVCT